MNEDQAVQYPADVKVFRLKKGERAAIIWEDGALCHERWVEECPKELNNVDRGEFDFVEADNQRLRDELEYIAGIDCSLKHEWACCITEASIRSTAKAALEGGAGK